MSCQCWSCGRGTSCDVEFCGKCEESLRVERAPTNWRSMDTAPRDGTTIVGLCNDEEVPIRWAEARSCMLATSGGGAGSFGPGWECAFNGLIVDDPVSWIPACEWRGM